MTTATIKRGSGTPRSACRYPGCTPTLANTVLVSGRAAAPSAANRQNATLTNASTVRVGIAAGVAAGVWGSGTPPTKGGACAANRRELKSSPKTASRKCFTCSFWTDLDGSGLCSANRWPNGDCQTTSAGDNCPKWQTAIQPGGQP